MGRRMTPDKPSAESMKLADQVFFKAKQLSDQTRYLDSQANFHILITAIATALDQARAESVAGPSESCVAAFNKWVRKAEQSDRGINSNDAFASGFAAGKAFCTAEIVLPSDTLKNSEKVKTSEQHIKNTENFHYIVLPKRKEIHANSCLTDIEWNDCIDAIRALNPGKAFKESE